MASSKKGLRLHEAIVAVMISERRFTMSTAEIARLNEARELFKRGKNKKQPYPDAKQMYWRVDEYPQFFQVEGDETEAVVKLRRFGDAD